METEPKKLSRREREEFEAKEPSERQKVLLDFTEAWFSLVEWLLITGALFYLARLTQSILLWILSVVSIVLFSSCFLIQASCMSPWFGQTKGHGWRTVALWLFMGLFIAAFLGVFLGGLVSILIQGGVQ